ncbi:MAG: two-component regulator propeller domain-containing protein [Bacteroidia bacterium]
MNPKENPQKILIVCCLLWVTLGINGFLWGQALTLPAVRYLVEDGLPDVRVRCLMQDSRGFLWVGTENGLSCFDGRMFRNYFSTEGADMISGNYITALTEDRDNILWIATLDGGLTRLDPSMPEGKRTHIFHFRPNDTTSLPVNRLRCVVDFNEEYILVSGEQAPAIFVHKKTFEIRSWRGTFPFHPSNAVASHQPLQGWLHLARYIEPEKLLISFLNNRRIETIHTVTGQPLKEILQPDYIAAEQTYVCLAWDQEHAYAGGWQHGITRWEKDNGHSVTKIPLPDEVETLLMQPGGKLLAGGHSQGLFEITTGSGQISKLSLFQKNGQPINPERVMAMIYDKDSSIWIGTNTGLINFWPGNENTTTGLLLPTEGNKIIFGMGKSPRGNPCIFSSRGIYEQNSTGEFQLFPFYYHGLTLQVTSLTHTPSFGWVLGTENGLFFLDSQTYAIRSFPPMSQNGIALGVFDFLQIRGIFEDTIAGQPVIVAGVLGYGVVVIDLHSRKIAVLIDYPQCQTCNHNSLVRKIVKTQEGNYWVGTSRGLYYWEFDHQKPGGKFVPWFHLPDNPNSLSSDDILDLATDEENTLWVATRNGLNAINGDETRRYRFPMSRGNVIHSIVPVSKRKILVSSNAGTGVFDKDLQAFSHISGNHLHESESIWMAGLWADSQSVLLAGQNYWRRVNPEDMQKNPEPPVPYLAGFSVNGMPVNPEENYILGYRDYFAAHISALHLHHAAAYDLAYRLGRKDQVWQTLSPDGVVFMSGLRPGAHNLDVRVVAKNGEVFHETTLLKLNVRPPFWLSWQFILSMVLLFTGSVIAFYQCRLSQHQKRQAIRMDIAGDLHDEVGSALGSIAMGSELATRFLEEDNEKSRLVLENIRSISRQTIQNMADIIWAIHPKHDQGENIAAKMKQVSNDLLAVEGRTVEYYFSPELESLRLSMQARKNFMLIYKEILHNIAKHAAASRVSISLKMNSRHLILSVSDNGRGFVFGNYPGNGLANMQRRAESMNAKIEIRSVPGNGTSVVLRADMTRIRD